MLVMIEKLLITDSKKGFLVRINIALISHAGKISIFDQK